MSIRDEPLPAGWCWDHYGKTSVIRAPGRGFCTIHWEKRNHALGFNAFVLEPRERPSGRAWRRIVVDRAVKDLLQIPATE